VPQFVDVQC